VLESLSLRVLMLEKIIRLSCAFSLNPRIIIKEVFFWNGVSDGMFGITALQNYESLVTAPLGRGS